VKINLTETELEGRKFQPIRHGISDDEKSTESEWMTCQVKDNIFNAAGDPSKLLEILRIFINWSK